MATLHPTTTRPARPRWLSVAAELASSIGILAGIAILSYCVLALELGVTA